MSGRYLVSFDSAPDRLSWALLVEAIGGVWEHIPPRSRLGIREYLDALEPPPYEPRLIVRELLNGNWSGPGWQAIYTFDEQDGEPLLTSVELNSYGGVPDDGITRRLIRDRLATGGAYTAAREYLHELLDAKDRDDHLAYVEHQIRWTGGPGGGRDEARERLAKRLAGHSSFVIGGTAVDAGYTVADALEGPHRPGSRGRSDKWYAAFAAEYVEMLASGSRRPVAELAKQHSLSPVYVRDILHEARRRKLLTDPPRGRAGGRLTPKAIELLSPEGDHQQ